MESVFQSGGGFAEWPWKGPRKQGRNQFMAVECIIESGAIHAAFSDVHKLRHAMEISLFSDRPWVTDETIEDFGGANENGRKYLPYEFLGQNDVLAVADNRERVVVARKEDEAGMSVLAQLKDATRYPEITAIARKYQQIRIYREWTFGRNAVFRTPQRADMRNDVLEEDFSNLGLVLNRLKTRFPAAKKAILNGLKGLYDGITDFDVLIEGGSVQVFFTEGDFVIPASRLSDGTLRYLCLLAILCDPTPPPLICIEEPELGLHPDVLPSLAELLIDASKRTQLIVTTHSDILVDAMTERPESVVICEKHNGCTEMKRLSKTDLAVWLNTYRLGQLWIDGQIGGKRW